ncbi:hypothetical protein BC936DRAFT_144577 [Jimgerdemannia flammicorona]|uniref:Uncharacterized protein n=2 Tax=Jimgerdemannia flammicorona TaxID=994334 RepID=A0A432ZXT1_9FUNG|nr:hypothetical protein BC936DRAFT_144577 [Jimgerdemannia flammicorona]RUS12533.1 hypothetical protein BC938DRAFT_478804 [Jimgerdemannia flammicorona]
MAAPQAIIPQQAPTKCQRSVANTKYKLCSVRMSTFKLPSTRYDGEYTKILELSKQASDYKSISDDFLRNWASTLCAFFVFLFFLEALAESLHAIHKTQVKKNAEGVRVENIFEVLHPKRIIVDHEDYRRQVEKDGDFVAKGLAEGNERLLYHGTGQNCHLILGTEDAATFCGNDANCAVCGLMMNSFDRAWIGKNRRGHTFQRLGQGFYFSDVPSKCHFYGQQGVSFEEY